MVSVDGAVRGDNSYSATLPSNTAFSPIISICR